MEQRSPPCCGSVGANLTGGLLGSRAAVRLMRQQPRAPRPAYHIFNLGFSGWGALLAHRGHAQEQQDGAHRADGRASAGAARCRCVSFSFSISCSLCYMCLRRGANHASPSAFFCPCSQVTEEHHGELIRRSTYSPFLPAGYAHVRRCRPWR